MQATNGFARTLRSRRGLVGTCMALALVAMAVMASAASATTPLPPSGLLSLGDSISYGYSQEKFEANFPTESPGAFEEGFVDFVAKKLVKPEKEAGFAIHKIDLACPGEVSDGLIGENALLGGGGEGNGKADDAPCAWHNVDGFPRHVEYGAVSQLEAAIGAVTNPAVPVHYVTIQIGSNDELAVVAACENPSYLSAHSFVGGLDECLVHEAGEEGYYYKGGIFKHIITNTGDAIGVLRHYGYTGPIAVLLFYNPQAIVLPGSDGLQKSLNEAFEATIGGGLFGPGVSYYNPFTFVNPQKGTAKEQAAICKFTEFCNEKDKKANLIKYLEEQGYTQEQAEAAATPEQVAKYPLGDIHPTREGYKKMGQGMAKALGA